MPLFLLKLSADAVMILHFGVLLFMFGGVVLTFFGLFWSNFWIRSFRWRAFHILLGVAIGLQDVLGVPCLLTDLEKRIRHSSGAGAYAGTFIEFWIDKFCNEVWLPTEKGISLWEWILYYTAASVVMALGFLLKPLPWPWRRKVQESDSPTNGLALEGAEAGAEGPSPQSL